MQECKVFHLELAQMDLTPKLDHSWHDEPQKEKNFKGPCPNTLAQSGTQWLDPRKKRRTQGDQSLVEF